MKNIKNTYGDAVNKSNDSRRGLLSIGNEYYKKEVEYVAKLINILSSGWLKEVDNRLNPAQYGGNDDFLKNAMIAMKDFYHRTGKVPSIDEIAEEMEKFEDIEICLEIAKELKEDFQVKEEEVEMLKVRFNFEAELYLLANLYDTLEQFFRNNKDTTISYQFFERMKDIVETVISISDETKSITMNRQNFLDMNDYLTKANRVVKSLNMTGDEFRRRQKFRDNPIVNENGTYNSEI